MDSKDRWFSATREACSRLAAKSYHILLCSDDEFEDHLFLIVFFFFGSGGGDLFVFYISIQLISEFTKETAQEQASCVGLASGRWRTLKAQMLCFRGHKLNCHPVFTENLSLVRNFSNSQCGLSDFGQFFRCSIWVTSELFFHCLNKNHIKIYSEVLNIQIMPHLALLSSLSVPC